MRARFVHRPNRFLIQCRLQEGPTREGRIVEAHLPDPGRLRELLQPGRLLWLRRAKGKKRKTAYSAFLIVNPQGDGLVSLNSTLPNRLIGRALEEEAMEEFQDWSYERREITLGGSRFDFLLSHADGRQLALEVKSVTLVKDGMGFFPDAITARGARHVRELAQIAGKENWEAAVLFVVQRSDARGVKADSLIDPVFAQALEEAREAGVEVYGRRCSVSLEQISLGDRIPVL